jgi:hypothetical protein
MAPRANWKGFLRLSLVTCPVALYPATSESEKVSFNQLNRKTGHRIKYAKVDADTGEEVANEDIVKGYKVDTDTFIEVTKEELENVALESTRTIEIDEFVDRSEIDPRYLIRPYYLVPDGKVGHDAFAVIRETIRDLNKVAIGRVVLTNPAQVKAKNVQDAIGPGRHDFDGALQPAGPEDRRIHGADPVGGADDHDSFPLSAGGVVQLQHEIFDDRHPKVSVPRVQRVTRRKSIDFVQEEDAGGGRGGAGE